MTTIALDRVIARVDTLPPLPVSIQRLVKVACNPASTLDEVVDAIRYDPSVTAEVLRLCNSAYFGLPRKVDSLERATCLLGTVRVFQLVVAASLRSVLHRPLAGYGLSAGGLWAHSAAVALAAELFAKRTSSPSRGLPFTAGLLHDIGKVVLDQFVRVEYAQILRRVQAEQITFNEAERQVLGYTHAEVGALLAERWQLPPAIVSSIRHHHEPPTPPAPDGVVDVVHLADAVCLMLGVGTGDDGLSYRLDPAVLARHALSATEVEALGAQAIVELKVVQGAFGAS